MFHFFKKKTNLEKLEVKYKKCLEEAFLLAQVNRTKSDEKYKEAEEIAQQIVQLKTS
ncbi:MAG: Lacal_2735 family protein [Flavobacteriales bacterium]|jgi:TRAP-type mannitol/chloroaromatic compound transport system substrate-binding protein|nr:Lacal_2735 family protein [Flavobacteriales bacterium]